MRLPPERLIRPWTMESPKRSYNDCCRAVRLRWMLITALIVGIGFPLVWYASARAERGRSDEKVMLRIIEDK